MEKGEKMRITHLCLASFFVDGYGYQENMLPKYHSMQGHDVSVITSLESFDKDGKLCLLPEARSYTNEYGIPVTRLKYKKPTAIYQKLRRYVGTNEALNKANPEILFIHGCQFRDMDIVVKYLKQHKNIRVYVDNHADFSNSATNWISRNILHKVIWKRSAHMILPYVRKFYGVLPARVDFLRNVYNLPSEKIELLVMGADDEKVEQALKPEVRTSMREKLGVSPKDFLIMTGGKIDMAKQQTLLLMDAVNKIGMSNVKLVVFGSVVPELKRKVLDACSDNVKYIGWVKASDTYDYFAAADLVVFPGRHSVFWEEVAGMGIPMICKYWDGTTHVDNGGNVIFLKNDTVDEIYYVLTKIVNDKMFYAKMKSVAEKNRMETFSYANIAARSIEFGK